MKQPKRSAPVAEPEATSGQPAPDAEAAAEEPSREQRIREAAYARYLKRGGAPGDATDDWLEAQAEVDGGQSEAQPRG